MVSIAALACLALSASAQTQTPQSIRLLNEKNSEYIPVFQYWKEHNVFQHLDVSVTAGTPGIGIDVASPIGDYVQLRAGYEIMPHFDARMEFNLTIGGKPARSYDADGNREITTFDKMKDFLYGFTGYDVEDHVDMIGTPNLSNFKLLVDVFPFKQNKHWHFTAGFYWGPSKFATAVNSTESMVSLLSVGMYNRMYEKAVAGDPLIDLESMGYYGVSYGDEVTDILYDKIKGFGRLGFSLGTFKHDVYDSDGNLIHQKGDAYIVEPGSDSMVRVKAKSNAFKPYLGFGYGGKLFKKDDSWKVSFDCGAMFWGGTPDLYVHDGVNLTKDVEGIGGQVGDYVSLIKAFKVYPVLSLRLTKTIF